MKQYCRYCSNAYLQGDELIYCKPKDEIRSGREITRLNHCPHFEFNPIDVLNPDHEYKPREQYRTAVPVEDTITENQISLFQEQPSKVIHIDEPPDCAACTDPTKKRDGVIFDCPPGEITITYTCENKECRRKYNAVALFILRSTMPEKED